MNTPVSGAGEIKTTSFRQLQDIDASGPNVITSRKRNIIVSRCLQIWQEPRPLRGLAMRVQGGGVLSGLPAFGGL